MAATIGVSAVSVRSIKNRLLKKLPLPESEDLFKLVEKKIRPPFSPFFQSHFTAANASLSSKKEHWLQFKVHG